MVMKVLSNIVLCIVIVYFAVFACAIDTMTYGDILYHLANMVVFYILYRIFNKVASQQNKCDDTGKD